MRLTLEANMDQSLVEYPNVAPSYDLPGGFLVLLSLQALLLLLGLVFNIIIFVLFCKKKSKSSVDYFPYSLAVADILLVSAAFVRFTLPTLVSVYFHSRADLVVKFELYGRILYVPAVPTSVCTTVAALAERYITLHQPFTGRLQCMNSITEKKASRIFLAIIFTFELLTVVFFVDWYLVSPEIQQTDGYKYGVVYFILLGVYPLLGYALPIFFVLMLFVKLQNQPVQVQEEVPLQELTEQTCGVVTFGDTVSTPTTNQSSTRAMKIISAMLFLLFPWFIMHYAQYLFTDIRHKPGLLALWITEYILIMVLASVKFIVYRLAWPDFKDQFLRQVCCQGTQV